MDESKNSYAGWKKLDKKRNILYDCFISTSKKWKLVNWSVVRESRSLVDVGGSWVEREGEILKDHEKPLELMDMFSILIVVMVSTMYTYVKLPQLYALKIESILC